MQALAPGGASAHWSARRRYIAPHGCAGRAVDPLFCRPQARGVAAAYLFGSQARGTAHRESDVDVGVLFDPPALPDRVRRDEAACLLGSELIAAT